MQIKSWEKYDGKLFLRKIYIRKIDFTLTRVKQLLTDVEGIDSNEVVSLLNEINDQNIQSMNLEKMEYIHRDQKLGFDKLSRAERVFLIAYIADKKKKNIYLHTDITQLTKKTLKLFFKKFYNSEYVNVVYDSALSDAFYNAMIKEAVG